MGAADDLRYMGLALALARSQLGFVLSHTSRQHRTHGIGHAHSRRQDAVVLAVRPAERLQAMCIRPDKRLQAMGVAWQHQHQQRSSTSEHSHRRPRHFEVLHTGLYRRLDVSRSQGRSEVEDMVSC